MPNRAWRSPYSSCRPGHNEPSFSNAGSATNSDFKGSEHLDWETLALWVFVAFSFAALGLVGYFIWAKCDGGSPFF